MIAHAWTDSPTNGIFANVKLGIRENGAKKVTNLMSKIAVRIVLKQNQKLLFREKKIFDISCKRMWVGNLVAASKVIIISYNEMSPLNNKFD